MVKSAQEIGDIQDLTTGERLVADYQQIAKSRLLAERHRYDSIRRFAGVLDQLLDDDGHLIYRGVQEMPDDLKSSYGTAVLQAVIIKQAGEKESERTVELKRRFDQTHGPLYGRTVYVSAVEAGSTPISVHFGGKYGGGEYVDEVTGWFAGLWRPEYETFTVYRRSRRFKPEDQCTVNVIGTGSAVSLVNVDFLD